MSVWFIFVILLISVEISVVPWRSSPSTIDADTFQVFSELIDSFFVSAGVRTLPRHRPGSFVLGINGTLEAGLALQVEFLPQIEFVLRVVLPRVLRGILAAHVSPSSERARVEPLIRLLRSFVPEIFRPVVPGTIFGVVSEISLPGVILRSEVFSFDTSETSGIILRSFKILRSVIPGILLPGVIFRIPEISGFFSDDVSQIPEIRFVVQGAVFRSGEILLPSLVAPASSAAPAPLWPSVGTSLVLLPSVGTSLFLIWVEVLGIPGELFLVPGRFLIPGRFLRIRSPLLAGF